MGGQCDVSRGTRTNELTDPPTRKTSYFQQAIHLMKPRRYDRENPSGTSLAPRKQSARAPASPERIQHTTKFFPLLVRRHQHLIVPLYRTFVLFVKGKSAIQKRNRFVDPPNGAILLMTFGPVIRSDRNTPTRTPTGGPTIFPHFPYIVICLSASLA